MAGLAPTTRITARSPAAGPAPARLSGRTRCPGSQPGSASSKAANSKAGETVQPTSVHSPSVAADCQSPAGTISCGRWPLLTSVPSTCRWAASSPDPDAMRSSSGAPA